MDYVLIVFGLLILIVAILGCFLPVLPGPPVGYIALVLLQFSSEPPFSLSFMIWMAIATALVTALDFFVPPLATRKFGGSRYGVTGSIIGLLLGLILIPPWGIFIFPFVGAYVGERFFGPRQGAASKAAFGAAVGQMFGILLKLSFTLMLAYFFIDGAPWS